MIKLIHRLGIALALGANVLPLLLTLGLASSARGDWWDDFLILRVTRDEFEVVLSRLDLSDQETDVARAVYDDFLAEYARAGAGIRTASEAGATGSDSNTPWFEAQVRLETKLESDVAALLADEAGRETWRHGMGGVRRRAMVLYLRKWQMQRDAVDLMPAFEALELAEMERNRVAPTVAEYEQHLDERLRFFQREHIRLNRMIAEKRAANDHEAAGRAAAEWRNLVEQIIREGEAFELRIANELEPANRLAFIEAVDRVRYLEAFEPCPAELAADAIKYVEDVSVETRAAIDAIYAEYAPLRDDLRRQVLDAVKKWRREDSPIKRELAGLTWNTKEERDASYARGSELRQQHPANPLLKRRHNSAMEAARRMRAIFKEDEFIQLPLAARLALDW